MSSINCLTAKGIILKSDEYKDKDRILTILTSDYGVLKACAKGTGSAKSKTSFLSVPYMLCDFTLSDSHGFWYVKEALIIESNSGILNDLMALAVASHIADVLDKSYLNSEVSKSSYELTIYSYYALSINPSNYSLIYSAFNARFLYISGLAASIDDCFLCKKKLLQDNSLVYFDMNNSDVYCDNCSSKGDIRKRTYKMRNSLIRILNYFYSETVSSIFTLKVSDNDREELENFTTLYLSYQLEEKIENPIKLLKNKFGL